MNKLEEIVPYIINNKCILFIGAGLSKIAGCYDWDEVVKDLTEHECIKTQINLEEVKKDRIRNEDLIGFCKKELYDNGREHEFWGITRSIIIKNPEKLFKQYKPVLQDINKINPFPNIITTNIDDCLEEVGVVDQNKIFYEPSDFKIDNLVKNSRSIFHIHGYKEKFKKSLLTTKEYVERYRKEWFENFLKHVFANYSVLFIGYSLRDSDLKKMLLNQNDNNIKHYALVPIEDKFSDSVIKVFSEVYNIRIIIYGHRKDFSNVLRDWISDNFSETNPETNSE